MKNILLFSFIFLSFISFKSFGQVAISLSYNNANVTNSTITLLNSVEQYIHVTNTGSTDMDIVIEITAITVPKDATGMSICWSNCYTPTSPQVLGIVNVPAGTTDESNFHVNYAPNGSTDPASVEFKIYESGNDADFITFIMDSQHVGINDINKNELIAVYPNPAIDKIAFQIPNEFIGSEYKLFDALGKEIITGYLSEAHTTLTLNSISKGLYYLSIYNRNNLIETKKLIFK